MSASFGLTLTNNSSSSLLSSNSDSETSLLSSNHEESTSLLSSPNSDGCFDGFAGKDAFGTCDLSNGSAGFLTANASSSEAAGSLACNSSEAAGSLAFGSSEAAGSVACSSGDSGSCGGGSFSSMC